MLSQKPYIHSKEKEEAVEVAEDGGVTIAEPEEATTSAPRCGAAGVARTVKCIRLSVGRNCVA